MQPNISKACVAIILFICATSVTPICAQNLNHSVEPVSLEHISVEAGLSQGMITCINQNEKGFMWFGTKDGVNRFDGYSFEIIRKSENTSAGLPGNYIDCIYEDDSRRLWIGTMLGGLTVYDPSTASFIDSTSTGKLNSLLSSKSIRSVQQDPWGNIWVSSAGGIDILKRPQSSNYNISSFSSLPLINLVKGIPENPFQISHWKINPQGILQMYTNKFFIKAQLDSGLNIIKYFKKDLSTLLVSESDSTCIPAEDTIRNILYLISESGIMVTDSRTGKTKDRFPMRIDMLNYPNPLIDKNGYLYLKTSMGLSKFDYKTKRLTKIIPKSKNIDEKILNNYFTAYKDQKGTMWFGTFGYGIIKMNPDKRVFGHIESYDGIPMSLSGIYETPSGNIIVQAYQQNDALVCDFENSIFSKPLYECSKLDKNLRNCNSVVFDNEHMYVAYERLLQINLNTSRVHSLSQPELNNSKIIYDPLLIDHKGRLWFANGHPSGKKYLYLTDKFSGQIVKTYEFPVPASHHEYRFVSAWKELNNGTFLFGTLKGLFQFDPDSEKWNEIKTGMNDKKDVIFSICPDTVNNKPGVWVGTNGNGLKYIDFISNNISHYLTVNCDIPNDVVYGILKDNRNNIWISTNKGIAVLNNKTGRFKTFSVSDGLQSPEFNRYAYFKDSKGLLYFGGIYGLNYLDPEKYYDNNVSNKINITSFRVYNKSVKAGESVNKKVLLNIPIEYSQFISIPYEISMITLAFASTDYSDIKQNKFVYRLRGLNDDWIPAGELHEATFTNLSPGSYTFEVAELAADGSIAESNTTSLVISVLPPWYATWWFRTLAGISLFSILYFLYRYKINQTLKIIKLRDKIAADLHDEVGSTLSSISITSTIIQKKIGNSQEEVTKLLGNISTSTDGMMESISDIVWAINTKNDKIGNLIDRMRAFSVEMLEPKNIQIQFDSDEDVFDTILDMQQRKNIYLIFKESIHNIVKYSHCKTVKISIQFINKKTLRFCVADDGIGFDIEAIAKRSHISLGGNGIPGMKIRAQQIKGHLEIDSESGKGTRICLVFKK